MPGVIEAPAPEVVLNDAPAPRRFEIPSFTDKKAEDAPNADAPKADPPPAADGEKPTVTEPPDPEAEAKAKARADRQKVSRLYKQAAEEKARREFAEKQLEDLRRPPPTAIAEGAPDPEKFTDIREYTKAVREHERVQAVKDYEHQQALKQSTAQQNKLVSAWDAQVDSGSEKYEDFDTVVGELKPTSPWAIAIMESDNAADVAYFLGKNLKEAQRIIALSPVSQIREIGKIEAKLLAAPPTPKPVSKAPAPISPVSGQTVLSEEITDGMPFEKFMKLRNRQLGRR